MDNLQNLMHYNWFVVMSAVIVAMMVFKGLCELFDWFVKRFGFETKSQRERREDREKLDATAKLAQQTATNLSNLETQHTKDEKEFRENLNRHMAESEKDRKALHQEMRQYSDNRVKDREQSLKIQTELIDAQNKISDSVQGLVDKFDEFKTDTNNRFETSEEKENKRVRAELKNSISGLYRYYHTIGKISDIDLETLEELIEEYEAAGGENSFVHSLVQKEMYTWEVIKRKLPDEI